LPFAVAFAFAVPVIAVKLDHWTFLVEY